MNSAGGVRKQLWAFCGSTGSRSTGTRRRCLSEQSVTRIGPIHANPAPGLRNSGSRRTESLSFPAIPRSAPNGPWCRSRTQLEVARFSKRSSSAGACTSNSSTRCTAEFSLPASSTSALIDPGWRTPPPCRPRCHRAITEPPLAEEPPQPAVVALPPPCASRRPRAGARQSRRGRPASLPSVRGSTATAWRVRRARRCS